MRFILLIAVSFTYLFANAHIFVYHRFGDDRYPSTNTTLIELEKQFLYFQKNGYEVVPIKKIIEKVKNKQEVPDHWVGLAIDDAYKSFYTNGLDLFKKYNYPFSLYVYVEATDKKYRDFMTWEQIKDASKYGSIGLHSFGHKRMTQISTQQVYRDTKKAYDLFSKKLGFEPKTYVHPYGEYNEAVLKELEAFNFDAIFNQSIGSITKDSKLNDINRIALVGKVNVKNKLRYKTMNATWQEPKNYPSDGVLKTVKASVDSKYKTMKLYITGYGWRDIKVNKGIINENLQIDLKKARTRIILSPDYYTIANKIIIKNKITKEK
ncbi:MAG: polysaccharide deacetylase family protein [Campylobacteraceae bacterium]|nr:polysaccharide deacetylase family protein [Campylobacteraceae bacterium]